MKAWKGFTPQPDGTLKCRDKIYVVGETYTEPDAVLCQTGMHACMAPIDVLTYYPPATSVYHEVEVDDDADLDSDGDSKVASKTMKVGVEVGISGLVEAQVKYATSMANLDGSHATRNYDAASATGTQGAASATGHRGAASATGDLGAASATGDYGVASATGYQSAASVSGEHSIAHADGYKARAKGVAGCGLTLAEREPLGGALIAIQAVIVGSEHDGTVIKADTWYQLIAGKVTEVDANGRVIK